jgi:iron complex transport system substrate-binding protein
MRRLQLYSLVSFLFFLSTGCRYHHAEKELKGKISVRDFRGRNLTFDQPVERAVCLIESALTGLYMLGVQNKVVGIPRDIYSSAVYPYYSKLDNRIELKQLPAPGNWDYVSVEQVVSLQPDLVILWTSQNETIEQIEQFGIPVYAIMMHNFNDVFKEITDLGKIFDCSQRADSLVNYTKDTLGKIKILHALQNPQKVYFMWAQGINETSGIKSTVNDLLAFAGVKNACTLEQEHVIISLESLADWNPDMIVMWYNEKLDPEDIINDPLLQGLDAIRNRKVYELPGVFDCDFWTLKMINPVRLIANWAYVDTSVTVTEEHEKQKLYRFLYQNAINTAE